MEYKIRKTKKSRYYPASIDEKIEKIISEEFIGNRAFEIYRKNPGPDLKVQNNWRFTGRELKGFYKQAYIKMPRPSH